MKRLILTALPLMVLPLALLKELPVQAQPAIFVQNASTFSVANLGGETLYLAPDTVFPHDLQVASEVRLRGINLPAGTVVRGQFEPVSGGLRYVATGFESGDRIYALQAVSDVLHDVKDPRETSAGAIFGDAAIGAAGGAVLGSILGGGVSAGEVIGGAAAGTIIGNVSAQRVVVVEPSQTVLLTVQ
ncbi:hypothetical protein C7271_02515 [filamentous cyanobacterium CCP5]|nr:hypothetical protein C7271_02515 [filamentous cyanobacterium CCP5]